MFGGSPWTTTTPPTTEVSGVLRALTALPEGRLSEAEDDREGRTRPPAGVGQEVPGVPAGRDARQQGPQERAPAAGLRQPLTHAGQLRAPHTGGVVEPVPAATGSTGSRLSAIERGTGHGRFCLSAVAGEVHRDES